jgi:putative transposase
MSEKLEKKSLPAIPVEVLDQLLAGGDIKDAFASGGLFDALKKALAERVLNAEMDHHLEREADADQDNRRNGVGRKTVLTDTGSMEISVPRDREGRFDPQLIGKYQRRFPGFDEKILSMYARGMSTRDIQGHLLEVYGLEVSPDLISTVTSSVLEEVGLWQNRPLEATYPIVFFDAIRVKIRDEGSVKNQAIHIALGVRHDGHKEVLGLWVEQNEGAKFWLRVMNELKTRGVDDILIAVVDGLKGFPDAITAVFPDAMVQTCIVHVLRNSLDLLSWKDRKPVATALKDIYRAINAEEAEKALTAFEAGPWGQKHAAIGQIWRRQWSQIIPFFAFGADVRKMIYTTNAIEALNAKLRRAVCARGHFPNEEAATKLLWLVLQRTQKNWTMGAREWSAAKSQFAIMFGERFIQAAA